MRLLSRPERLTYDPSFSARSFTATARSGSYQNARRGERSVHPSYATNMPSSSVPPRHPSAPHVGRTSATAHSAVRSGDPYARQNATDAQDAHRADPHANADHKDKKKSLAHRVRSAKAERQFNKTFGTHEPAKPGPEQSSRPALYEMKMGKTHKRSARMQNGATSKKKRGFFARFRFAARLPRSRALRGSLRKRSSLVRPSCSRRSCSISRSRTIIKKCDPSSSSKLNMQSLPITIRASNPRLNTLIPKKVLKKYGLS